ncbi:MAG: RNA polymerase sigma factor [Planctomycetaceae bacterium]|nr:MAG: RNA polymerase sigma factor [Planctomycetaceae bacterium]
MEKKAKLAEQKADLAYLKNTQRNLDRDKEHHRQKRDSLASRLRAGDRAAAAELVDTYHEQIYLFMRRLGHDRQASEDLTQESFFNAWHHIGQLKDGKALNGWLYRIASNVSKLHWRKHKHKEVIGIEGLEMPQSDKGEPEKMEHNEQLEHLKDAVERLPIKLRETISLHYMQQLTIAEAAEAVGLNQGTFKSRLNRALKTLRKEII